jgi:histidyl-tRNA synthetase
VDLPALGFGMGDVVLGELLRARGLMRADSVAPQYWVAGTEPELLTDVMEAATALRRAGASVEYALRAQQLGRQLKAAASAGVAQVVIVDDRFRGSGEVMVKALDTGGERICRLDRETGALTPVT